VLQHAPYRSRRAFIDAARELSEADARRRLVASLTTPIGLISTLPSPNAAPAAETVSSM
jgi:hypothetical protein